MATHVLFESASGYAIFEAKQQEEIGAKTKAVQASIEDLQKFGKMVQLISFSPFKSAAHALENANDVSEGNLAKPLDDVKLPDHSARCAERPPQVTPGA